MRPGGAARPGGARRGLRWHHACRRFLTAPGGASPQNSAGDAAAVLFSSRRFEGACKSPSSPLRPPRQAPNAMDYPLPRPPTSKAVRYVPPPSASPSPFPAPRSTASPTPTHARHRSVPHPSPAPAHDRSTTPPTSNPPAASDASVRLWAVRRVAAEGGSRRWSRRGPRRMHPCAGAPRRVDGAGAAPCGIAHDPLGRGMERPSPRDAPATGRRQGQSRNFMLHHQEYSAVGLKPSSRVSCNTPRGRGGRPGRRGVGGLARRRPARRRRRRRGGCGGSDGAAAVGGHCRGRVNGALP